MALADLLAGLGHGVTGVAAARVWKCAQCRAVVQESAPLCQSCQASERTGRQRARLRHAWGSLPDRFRDAWTWQWDPERKAVLEGAGSRGLLFLGPPGSGKTALACAILGRWIQRAEADGASWDVVEEAAKARYVTDSQLVAAASAHPLGQGDAPLVKAAVRASLLVLDELGSDLSNPRKTARDVLFARYDLGKSTILTTGQTREDVERYWGGGAGRRIWAQSYNVDLGKMPEMRVVK